MLCTKYYTNLLHKTEDQKNIDTHTIKCRTILYDIQ